ncbi:MAG: AAA family ATPase [bacterium]
MARRVLRSKKDTVSDMQQLGWSKSVASQAFAKWGPSAISILAQDPYVSFYLPARPPWNEADAMARKAGLPETGPERIAGAVRYSLLASTNDGHVYIPWSELQQRVTRLVSLDNAAAWNQAVETLIHQREIFVVPSSQDSQAPVYMNNLYRAERGVAQHLARLFTAPSRVALQAPGEADLNRVEKQMKLRLADLQRTAVSASLSSKVLIITGGPGTGKTTILRGVLHLWSGRGAKIRLAAPTGRAAKRLSESTGRQAFTLHRLLEYSPESGNFLRHGALPLKADLMVVDEASMIDTELMAALLDALPPEGHLLLVGDVDQLPAVGPGFVLHDLIESGLFPTIRLNEIFRQKECSLIPTNARKINQGEYPDLEGQGVENGQDFFFVPRSSAEAARDAIVELVTQRIPRQFGFDPKEHIQVLCPMIKKDAGVEKMNEILQEKLNPADTRLQGPFYSFSIGDKIMQTKNDYDKDVFNGDIGFVCDWNRREKLVIFNFEGKEVPYRLPELENTALAYACTVHKSQGSEYPAVVVPLVMQHYPMLQRNLLYTAVSRGKQLVILVGEQQALEIAVRNNRIRKRYTGLGRLLKETFASLAAPSAVRPD